MHLPKHVILKKNGTMQQKRHKKPHKKHGEKNKHAVSESFFLSSHKDTIKRCEGSQTELYITYCI